MHPPLTPEPIDRGDPASLWQVTDARQHILLTGLLQAEAEWWAKAGEYYCVLQGPNPQEIGS